jgi:outer membrane protein assembly factor BamB
MTNRVLLGATLFTAALGIAAEYPRFRGPDGSGASTETGLPLTWSLSENVAWKAALPGAGTSSPVFVGDRIFITCYTGYNVPGKPRGDQADLRRHLLCLDRKSGKTLWDTEIAADVPEQATIREEHGYASSTPVADSERVYCFFGKSGVFAFDHAGKQLWRTSVGTGIGGWGSATSPILHEDLVIVNACVESESLVALDRKTGKEVWRTKKINESWNTPLVVPVKGGKPELIVAVFGKVLGIDPASGERLWSCDTDIGWYMVPSVVVHDGVVYCIGGRNGGGALAVKPGGKGDVTATHRLWTLKKGSNVSSPVYHEGHLYFMNDVSGLAYCVKADTGEAVYEERVGRAGQVYASALLAEGRVYYVTRDGRTFVIAAKPKFEVLASNDLRDRSTYNATPVAVDGRLFIRSDSHLYCLEKKD